MSLHVLWDTWKNASRENFKLVTNRKLCQAKRMPRHAIGHTHWILALILSESAGKTACILYFHSYRSKDDDSSECLHAHTLTAFLISPSELSHHNQRPQQYLTASQILSQYPALLTK